MEYTAVLKRVKIYTPGQGRVLHGIVFLVICPPALTILNFSPPPHVLEHSDQPVSGAEKNSERHNYKKVTAGLQYDSL